jgi:fatty-acyl-CoA synthase|tara:strand:+ start:8282 stop:10165 length:1884 start_codon:yes stop_codon:yes gene_type:complete
MFKLANTPAPEPIMETLAKVEEFEKTPLAEQFPFTDSYNLITSSAARFGNDIALEFIMQGLPDEPTSQVTFTQLSQQITRTANLLTKLGVNSDTAVSIIMPILPQTHFATWGSQAAGIANPINPMLEAEHIGEIIAASNSSVVICLGKSQHVDIWDKVIAGIKGNKKITAVIAVNVPGLCEPLTESASAGGYKILDFETAIADQPGDQLTSKRIFSGDQIAAYFHTGGTTGRPKLAQLTHQNMAFLGQLMQVYTAHQGRQSILCGLPLFHIYGCIIQGVAAFAVGYRILLMTPSGFRSPVAMKSFWKHIDRFNITSFATVPTVLMALSDLSVGDSDISTLTNVNSGAAPLSEPFKVNFEKQHQVDVSNGYGMTETTALISRAPANQPPGSVGMRIPYSQIRIVHLDGTTVIKNCELGESGAIMVKGPQVFAGYKADSDNKLAWVEDGWFNTGDLGYLDSDGFLYLSGRAKDLIIRGGHNIDPELIEEPLNAHPGVSISIAIGLPDRYAGELPMAYVVRVADSQISAEQLIEHCANTMSERAAIPKRIEFIDAMPLTAVGKIFRPTLRQQITETLVKEVLASISISAQVASDIEKKRGLVIRIDVDDKSTIDATSTLFQNYIFTTEVN